jgi:hypothetical protein
MKGKDMMKVSTKLTAIGAASVLGVALAAGGAQAASAALTARDAPGQVLQVSGVVPASAQANATATAQPNPNAKGLSGATVAHPDAHATTHDATHSSVSQVARPAAQPLPSYHAEMPCGGDHGGWCQPSHSSPGMNGSTGMSGSTGMMR